MAADPGSSRQLTRRPFQAAIRDQHLRGGGQMSKLSTDLGERSLNEPLFPSSKSLPVHSPELAPCGFYIIVAAFLALGLFLDEKYVTWHTAPQAATASSDDEIYTGSIL